MAEYQIIVLTNAKPGRDADFNDWYSNRHIPDMIAIPGIVSARRFSAIANGDFKYAAIYTLDCDDPQTVLDEIDARWGTDKLVGSDAADGSRMLMMTVKPI